MHQFDLIVVGSGPAGRRAAIQAAKLEKKVLVIEKGSRVGGVSVHTGTIPSKTLRETALNLTGWRERGFYGRSYRVKQEIDAGKFPGAVVLVARKGKLVYAEAIGMQDKAAGKAMAKDSLFRIYSMTKPMVSVAAMLLVEDGRLQLTDLVGESAVCLAQLQHL